MIKEINKSNINLINIIATYINENKNVDNYLAEELWMISKDIVEYINSNLNLNFDVGHSEGDMFTNSDVLHSISSVSNCLFNIDEDIIDNKLNNLLTSYIFISKLISENDK